MDVKKFKNGDKVQVVSSSCGYKGKGEVIGPAYLKAYLVKIEAEGFNSIILVKEDEMKKLK
jgi:hypothetical protein